jgi:PAS domain S-box-containing protein
MSEKVNFLKFVAETDEHPGATSLVRTFAESFPAPICIYTANDGKLEYANHAFTDFTGLSFTEDNSFKSDLTDFVAPEDLALLRKAIENISILPRSSDRTTCRIRNAAGGFVSVDLQVIVLRKDGEGQLSEILLIAEDAAGKQELQTELALTRKMFQETESLMQFGSWSLDCNTQTMSMTPGMIDLLEYGAEQPTEDVPYEFFLGHLINGYRQAWLDKTSLLLAGESEVSFESMIRTRSRTHKTVLTRAKSVMEGNALRIVGITRDITTVRTLEKEQERNIRELNRSNKELEEFAYVASHDLQEPLRKITMFTERLKSKFANSLDQEGGLFMDRIVASATNMRVLIDNLLEFSRTSRTNHDYVPVALSSIWEQVLADFELKIEETQSRVEFRGALPVIEAVAVEMKQLFGNLVSNAIKFRKSGSPAHIEVATSVLSREEKIRHRLPKERTFYSIAIRDNGVGFEEVYAEKIFQVFQRLHGKSEYPGSGIGLAICKKITDNHNGVIYAHSVPDEGATFTVILPEKQL